MLNNRFRESELPPIQDQKRAFEDKEGLFYSSRDQLMNPNALNLSLSRQSFDSNGFNFDN